MHTRQSRRAGYCQNMHPAFATIRLGPVVTEYHRRAVDEQFWEDLSAYLEARLLPQLDEPYDSTEGTLTPEVSDERSCGPHSLVRDAYELTFAFHRRGGESDTLDAKIRYRPATRPFVLRWRGHPLVLWTRKRRALQQAYSEAIDAMVARIAAGEVADWTCPACQRPLRAHHTPADLSLTCPHGCFTYGVHMDPKDGGMRSGHCFSRFFEWNGEEREDPSLPE
jgi:hypothetical protein